MGNPHPREGEELFIANFVYAAGTSKAWSDIADIAYTNQIANFVFAAGTNKPQSDITDIANIPNIGTVKPIAYMSSVNAASRLAYTGQRDSSRVT